MLDMDFSRKLPIGVQSFKVLREENYLYVDKTAFVYKLASSGRVYFLSRPRRFGKSLFLSTLAAYFRGQKELFKGLAIEQYENAQKNPWQEYPVFYLDFNTGEFNTRENLLGRFNFLLSDIEKTYGIPQGENIPPGSRFENAIKSVYEKTGKQVVVLVDEYDKPLLQSIGNDALNDELRSLLKAFYSVLKSADEYLRFSFLTGVTKFSKISIFSDLNNLRDISINDSYSTICGITQAELEARFQPEIQKFAEKLNITREHMLAELNKKYDGYLFSSDGENVYNPFSVLHSFADLKLNDYWFATGTPTFLVDYLKAGQYFIPDLDGGIQLNEAALETYRAAEKEPLPILFQSGYLTIKEYDNTYRMYRLGFPNDEVRYGFLENLLPAYTSFNRSDAVFSVVEFTKAIQAGEVDDFMTRMQAMIASIPYDNFSEKDVKLREQNYQIAVYLVFALMGQFVQTEVHCATGRADCVVETDAAVYIFEFKLTGNGSPADAIAQIKEKNYAGKYRASGKPVTLVGASFDEAKRTIKEWTAVRGGLRG